MGSHPLFEHTLIDTTGCFWGWPPTEPGYVSRGCVTVADYDGDGYPEYTIGGVHREDEQGFLFQYDRDPETGDWSRRDLFPDFWPDVGAAALDVDGDGNPELVCSDNEHGILRWVVMAPDRDDYGTSHNVSEPGPLGYHDVLTADLDGDGREEVLVREKGRRLLYHHVPEADPTDQWPVTVIDDPVPGDGTLVADLSDSPGLDVVTAVAWYENVAGDGTDWERHPVLPPELDWHPETRIAMGDVDGDGEAELVVTESEEDEGARLAVCSRPESDDDYWDVEVVFPAEADYRAMHSLALADFDGDGQLEIFTAEMENKKTDGVEKRPRWYLLSYEDGEWDRTVLLDENLGTHCATVIDANGDGRPDIIGKTWRANEVNGVDGQNHIDLLTNVGGR
ncbi:FG-GAP repeat domain-containing protein [Haloarchaeobius sp. TZWSO28]|uniref:FG-GAP repeat domain-containing protein n=1 Tax=Haloarchaeobius sp. TZWSO28 TaxID=3446119 RepID=UPI003EC11938